MRRSGSTAAQTKRSDWRALRHCCCEGSGSFGRGMEFPQQQTDKAGQWDFTTTAGGHGGKGEGRMNERLSVTSTSA